MVSEFRFGTEVPFLVPPNFAKWLKPMAMLQEQRVNDNSSIKDINKLTEYLIFILSDYIIPVK